MTVNGNRKYLPLTKILSLYAIFQLKLDAKGSQTLDFGVTSDMDKTSACFLGRVDLKSNQILSDPFGGAMFNVKLASLAINGHQRRRILGQMWCANAPSVARRCWVRNWRLGLIHFQDSKPAVVVVEYGLEADDGTTNATKGSQQQQLTTKLVDATLPISDVYQQLLQLNSGSK